jgi:hypothetical protein
MLSILIDSLTSDGRFAPQYSTWYTLGTFNHQETNHLLFTRCDRFSKTRRHPNEFTSENHLKSIRLKLSTSRISSLVESDIYRT